MKSKEEIVQNWLPRYTGEQLENFGQYILLTNFSNYVKLFAEWNKVPIIGMDKPMQCATAEGITCATLSDDLGKGINRYPAYWDEVRAHSRIPVFVTRVDPGPSPEPRLDAAVRTLLWSSGVPTSATKVGTYTIYQPSGPVALPPSA